MIPSEILRKVRQIEIRTRSVVNSVLSGAYSSTFKGRGMEFAEVREYLPGDEIRSIDWNVTARQGHPFVKKYVEERELTVLLVVDASSSGEFGSQREMKGEVMATISALLAFSAIKNNDRVGLLIFTSKVEKYIPPQKGKKHVMRVIRELLYHEPEERGTDLGAALEQVNRLLKRRAVVFLVSDFASADFQRPMRLLQQRHDAVAITVVDPRERDLPDVGFLELEDAETGEIVLIDTGSPEFRETFRKEVQTESSHLRRLFRRTNTDFVEVFIKPDYDDTIQPLLDYFRKRAKNRG
ncbi:MAG TPA: DUF58 domain-containing protein [Fibrobacteres bacterium]|jgi:uncharacterized protein (DUF58 family)|nr:DUF58 domain-containing protein [Fibrobacterota bacterium]